MAEKKPASQEENKQPKKEDKGHTVWKSIGGNNPDTIGGNCHAYSYTDKEGKTSTILVDMGSLFCDEEKTGYASILPDAREYLESKDKKQKAEFPAEALFVTHGHMDHIGAIPHLYKMGYKLPKIYGTKLSLEFVKIALSRERVPWQGKQGRGKGQDKKPFVYESKSLPELVEVAPGDKIKIGDMEIEPVSVTHSIPDAVGFYIKTPSAKLFHSGDMKTDQTVKVSNKFDKNKIEEISKENLNAILSDSTSVIKPGKTPPEAEIEKELLSIAKEHPDNRLVMPMISSSTQRLASIATVAVETGRTIVLEGSSVIASERALRKAGYDLREIVGGDLKMIDGKTKAAAAIPDNEKIVVCTGTQGEEVASFPKAVNWEYTEASVTEDGKKRGRENPFVITKDDVVIMAQTPIPGNEDTYFGILEKTIGVIGAKVYTPKAPKDNEKLANLLEVRPIHASGHGGSGDIEELYSLGTKHSKDKNCVAIPVHGSKEHLVANAKVANKLGLKASLHQNFEALEISEEGVKPVEIKKENGKVSVKETQAKPAEGRWLAAESSTGDWRQPFYNYDVVDKDYKKVERIYEDKGPKFANNNNSKTDDKSKLKKAIQENKKRYRKTKEVFKKALAKRFWRDVDY